MPWQSGGCDPRLAALLKQWLAFGSFALMATERIAAVLISLTHNNLATIADTALEAQAVRDAAHQISLQRQVAISMAQMATTHAEMLQELAEDLQHELAEIISEVSFLTHRGL